MSLGFHLLPPFMRLSFPALLLVVLLVGCAEPPPPEPPAPASPLVETVVLDSFFASVDGPGTFVLVDGQTGHIRIHNPERARSRFLPASTFKIPNTLIALETGVADGPDFSLPFDPNKTTPQEWWPEAWTQDPTLRTAFQNSVYWYYQEIARRIGPERMDAYVAQFAYGNQALTPTVDLFWLEGDLRISPEEQVAFLRRVYTGDLGVSERTTAILKAIMVLEETDTYRLSGKTGTAEVTPTREMGWLVGYVERGSNVYYYALNMEGEQVWEQWPPQKRKELVIAILKALLVLPADA